MPGKLGVGVAFGYSAREGFTKNDVTGHDLDFRSAVSGKGQISGPRRRTGRRESS